MLFYFSCEKRRAGLSPYQFDTIHGLAHIEQIHRTTTDKLPTVKNEVLATTIATDVVRK